MGVLSVCHLHLLNCNYQFMSLEYVTSACVCERVSSTQSYGIRCEEQ